MSTPVLTRKQWTEIYYALDLRIELIKAGIYGTQPQWAKELHIIQETIGRGGQHMVQP